MASFLSTGATPCDRFNPVAEAQYYSHVVAHTSQHTSNTYLCELWVQMSQERLYHGLQDLWGAVGGPRTHQQLAGDLQGAFQACWGSNLHPEKLKIEYVLSKCNTHFMITKLIVEEVQPTDRSPGSKNM